MRECEHFVDQRHHWLSRVEDIAVSLAGMAADSRDFQWLHIGVVLFLFQCVNSRYDVLRYYVQVVSQGLLYFSQASTILACS